MMKPFGENRILIEFDDNADIESVAAKANATAELLRQHAEILEAVSGIDSVCVSFDPFTTSLERIQTVVEGTLSNTPQIIETVENSIIEIPVCYGGAFGPDLETVADQCGLSVDDVIARHISKPFPVLTIGFAPGFAYLGPIDQSLYMPRLENPRPSVAAGSVGIAGEFTGVYPLPSPGGWRLIGRTPTHLFNPEAASPFVLHQGVSVQFKSISSAEFEELAS